MDGWRIAPQRGSVRLTTTPARVGVVLALLLPLTGCGKSVDLTNASLAEVAEKSDGVRPLQPGRWETTRTMTAVDTSQVRDPVKKARLQGRIGQDQVARECSQLTDTPALDTPPVPGMSCRYDHYRAGGGLIDSKLTCTGDPGTITLTEQGSYSETGSDLMVNQRTVRANGRLVGGVTYRITAKRLGDC